MSMREDEEVGIERSEGFLFHNYCINMKNRLLAFPYWSFNIQNPKAEGEIKHKRRYR